jgi:hypothetical protein
MAATGSPRVSTALPKAAKIERHDPIIARRLRERCFDPARARRGAQSSLEAHAAGATLDRDKPSTPLCEPSSCAPSRNPTRRPRPLFHCDEWCSLRPTSSTSASLSLAGLFGVGRFDARRHDYESCSAV